MGSFDFDDREMAKTFLNTRAEDVFALVPETVDGAIAWIPEVLHTSPGYKDGHGAYMPASFDLGTGGQPSRDPR